MDKRKLLGIIIGLVAFIALVAGATYAWFTWTSGPTTIGGTAAKFVINYVKGTDISGSLTPSTDETGGVNTAVTISRTSDSISGTAKLTLDNISLTQATLGTCSDPAHTTESACTTALATWTPLTATWSALKWIVKNGSTTIATGDFSTVVSNSITLFTAESLNETATTYTVYIWLDGNVAGNEYIGAGLTAKISASAVQTG